VTCEFGDSRVSLRIAWQKKSTFFSLELTFFFKLVQYVGMTATAIKEKEKEKEHEVIVVVVVGD
jgi:hypothetical protein